MNNRHNLVYMDYQGLKITLPVNTYPLSETNNKASSCGIYATAKLSLKPMGACLRKGYKP